MDSIEMIRRMSSDRIARLGYMPARCEHEPGCPDHIHTNRPPADFDYINRPEEIFMRSTTWNELHPGAELPPFLAQPCCAQFGVSRERVRQIPKERFIHYREWLLNTKLSDQISGRVFEYLWQYIFTGKPQLCPAPNSCYCDGYGVCYGGAKEYEKFKQKLDDKNRLEKELRKWEERKRANEKVDLDEFERIGQKVNALAGEIHNLSTEAMQRGEDPKNRERERESINDELFYQYLEENMPPDDWRFQNDFKLRVQS
jgi:hypothetical protein